MGPIEIAAAAFVAQVAAAVVAAGLVSAVEDLAVDPAAPIGADEISSGTGAAALFTNSTRPVRELLGGPPTFVVEREITLELAAAGPDPAARDAVLRAALAGCAAIAVAFPPLGGDAERCELNFADIDDLAPNGVKHSLSFVLRVRAGDPLGLTAA